MDHVLTAAELKRRGMVAIEEGLRADPWHILKRNKPAAERPQQYHIVGFHLPELCTLSSSYGAVPIPIAAHRLPLRSFGLRLLDLQRMLLHANGTPTGQAAKISRYSSRVHNIARFDTPPVPRQFGVSVT